MYDEMRDAGNVSSAPERTLRAFVVGMAMAAVAVGASGRKH